MAKIRTAVHAAEGGNWYTQDGQQITTVPNAKGDQQTKCTLRHARKMGLCRGVTSIIGQTHRADLERWKITQGIKSALMLDRLRGIDHAPHYEDKAYLDEIFEHSMQRAIEAADEGSRIHAAIQAHYMGESYDERYKPHVDGVVECLLWAVGQQQWEPEKTVTSPLGYGTKVDLVSDQWLLDWKTKDGDQSGLNEMKVYDGYDMQLAAGRQATGNDKLQCAIVLVSRDHPGVAVFKPVPEENLQRGLIMFNSMLEYTFAKDEYAPPWRTAKSSG